MRCGARARCSARAGLTLGNLSYPTSSGRKLFAEASRLARAAGNGAFG